MSTAVVQQKRKKKSSRGPWVIASLVIVLALLVLGTLHYTGKITLPFLASRDAEAANHEGQIRIPCAAGTISRFRAVRQTDLQMTWIKPEDADKRGLLKTPGDVIGRVMRFDKQSPYAFKETDFFPRGSQETPALGVEPGKLGRAVDPEQVEGLSRLTSGDRFQVYATLAAADSRALPVAGSPAVAEELGERNAWSAHQQLVVRDGLVILAGSKAKGASKDDKQYYIQLDPVEFGVLDQALLRRARLTCAVIGAATPKDVTPAMPVEPPTEAIEVVSGSGHSRTMQPETTPQKDGN